MVAALYIFIFHMIHVFKSIKKIIFLFSLKVGLCATYIIQFSLTSRKTVADFVTDFVTDCVFFSLSSRWGNRLV